MRVNCDDEWASVSTSLPNIESSATGSASGKSNGIAPRRNNTITWPNGSASLYRFLRPSDALESTYIIPMLWHSMQMRRAFEFDEPDDARVRSLRDRMA